MRAFSAGPLPRPDTALVTVLLISLVVRVWGLMWGLPSATHYFSYHPDESRVLEASSVTMNVFTGHLLPHFYNYGSLQLYLVCFANSLAALFGAIDNVPKEFALWYPEWAKMYLVGRWLTVGMGVGTVWTVYAIGQRLWGRRAGLIAALTLAITPLHAQHSHFLTVDVPATFWAVLSLLWAVRLATEERGSLKSVLWAGVFAGLAAATKYNLALMILPLIVAFTLRKGPLAPNNGGMRGAVLGLSAFAVAFLLACPGAVLESKIFLHDLRFEAVHMQNADDYTFRDTGNGFVYQIRRNLDAGLGLPLLLLSLISIGYAMTKRERGDVLLASCALPYFILIGLASIRYARYDIPLLPILSLWNGRFFANTSCIGRISLRKPAMGICTGILGLTALNCLCLIQPMAEIDPRDRAYTWLQTHDSEAAIGFPTMPWFGTVPLSPYFAMPQRGGWRKAPGIETSPRIDYSGKDWDITQQPPVIVLSEYDFADALRLQDPAAAQYQEMLRDHYTVAASFVRTSLFARGQRQNLPHDMTYPSPAIYLYQRKTD